MSSSPYMPQPQNENGAYRQGGPAPMYQGGASAHPVQHNTIVLVNPKSKAIAYLLWFFLGGFGAHKLYLKQTGMFALYLVLYVLGISLSLFTMGLTLIPLCVMLLVDIFTIPGRVDYLNRSIGNTIL